MTLLVSVYHVRFKKYNGLRTSESDALPKIVIANVSKFRRNIWLH